MPVRAGKRSAAKTAMMAITMSSSTRVNALALRLSDDGFGRGTAIIMHNFIRSSFLSGRPLITTGPQ